MPPLPQRIQTYLSKTMLDSTPITYNALAQAMNLSPPNTIHQITTALESLMDQDVAVSRPLIASFVISKSGNGLPAAGFFNHAQHLGRYAGASTGPDAQEFHKAELIAAIAFYRTR